jgi:hypothetical protein
MNDRTSQSTDDYWNDCGLRTLLDAHETAASQGQSLLTDAGISFARQLLLGHSDLQKAATVLPSWDGRRLWLGGELLKDFGQQPAPYQTRLLDAFQNQGWAINHLGNALMMEEFESEDEAKERLRNTVGNLNRTLQPGTIRFGGDGTGKGVYWDYA